MKLIPFLVLLLLPCGCMTSKSPISTDVTLMEAVIGDKLSAARLVSRLKEFDLQEDLDVQREYNEALAIRCEALADTIWDLRFQISGRPVPTREEIKAMELPKHQRRDLVLRQLSLELELAIERYRLRKWCRQVKESSEQSVAH